MTAAFQPPAHTPLIALPAMVIDVETTGLQVRSDRVVQIGAIAMIGDAEQETPRLDQIVDPEMPIPARVTRIHGLDDTCVTGAPRFSEVAPDLLAMLQGRCAIGHHVGFDLAILRHETARAGLPWRDVPMLDIAQLARALDPGMRDLELEAVLARLGVSVEGRHSAMGDCRATAKAWACLQASLRTAGIRTLGEAQALCALRGDGSHAEAEAGWATLPDTAAHAPPTPAAVDRLDRYAFERQLSELMREPVHMIDPNASLRDAARMMVEQRIGALLIGEPDSPPLGILTERDLLRVVAQSSNDVDSIVVTMAMHVPVETMSRDELLYRALARMDRLGIRHLCVVGENGVALGMVSQRDLLQHRARGADMLSDALFAAQDSPALAAAYARLPEVATRLVAEGLNGTGVARIVSTELHALMRRITELALARLQAEGAGPAPAPWCLAILGSGGRNESLLAADQDHALIHTGTPADDPWFAQFGDLIAEFLDAAGVRRCPGGVMACNPEWRGTLADWRKRVDDWLTHPRLGELLRVDCFFDLAPVAGDAELSRTLQSEAVCGASTTPAFLAILADSTAAFVPRFNLFGKVVTDDGRADLKRDGLLALVKAARVLALSAGSSARTTAGRLCDAQLAGRLPERDAVTLVELHEQLLTLVLRQQLSDLGEGIPPSSRVVSRAIDRKQRARLVHGLRVLDAVVRTLRATIAR